MANKNLFKNNAATQISGLNPFNILDATDTTNRAGGKAYSLSPKSALAQYASTGVFNNTLYASAQAQLEEVLKLCRQVEPEFIAKLAIYTREKGLMKDMPAFLVAYLGAIGQHQLLTQVFSRVIDSPKMLRNVVQIWRSGTMGRKSLGTRPKKLVQAWLANHTEEALFRGSIGKDPSLVDVIKLSHPKPATPERDNFYHYLLGKEYRLDQLPQVIQDFEAFKKDTSGDLPRIPFEMATSFPLTPAQWKQLALQASWTQIRMNLNTFQRHGVFEDSEVVEKLASKLSDPEQVRRAKVFPYQLFAAYINAVDLPEALHTALLAAMEVAVSNVPAFEGKKVYVLPDVSGSMHDPVTGNQGSATSKMCCIDVAALFTSAVLRQNPTAEVIAFGERVVMTQVSAQRTVLDNAKTLASAKGGGTNCAVPLSYLNRSQAVGDLCIMISDNESWKQASAVAYGGATGMMQEWEKFKQRNPQAKLVCVDINPNTTTQVKDRQDVLNCGGFSDSVFQIVESFVNDSGSNHWPEMIEKIQL